MGASSAMAAALCMLLLVSGCRGGSDLGGDLIRTDSDGFPGTLPAKDRDEGRGRDGSHPVRWVLPEYLAGYPASQAVQPVLGARVWVEPNRDGRECSDQLRALREARADLRSVERSGETRAYLNGDKQVLWAGVYQSEHGKDLRAWGRATTEAAACLADGDTYIVTGIGTRVLAARIPTPDGWKMLLLRANPASESSLIVACTPTVGDSNCRAAMPELLHFLGL